MRQGEASATSEVCGPSSYLQTRRAARGPRWPRGVGWGPGELRGDLAPSEGLPRALPHRPRARSSAPPRPGPPRRRGIPAGAASVPVPSVPRPAAGGPRVRLFSPFYRSASDLRPRLPAAARSARRGGRWAACGRPRSARVAASASPCSPSLPCPACSRETSPARRRCRPHASPAVVLTPSRRHALPPAGGGVPPLLSNILPTGGRGARAGAGAAPRGGYTSPSTPRVR